MDIRTSARAVTMTTTPPAQPATPPLRHGDGGDERSRAARDVITADGANPALHRHPPRWRTRVVTGCPGLCGVVGLTRRSGTGGVVTSPARLREHEVLTAALSALCADRNRTGSTFCLGAMAALRWLTQGGPGPLTDALTGKPVTFRAIVRELSAAEALIYGRPSDQRWYAAGVRARPDVGAVRHSHPARGF